MIRLFWPNRKQMIFFLREDVESPIRLTNSDLPAVEPNNVVLLPTICLQRYIYNV